MGQARALKKYIMEPSNPAIQPKAQVELVSVIVADERRLFFFCESSLAWRVWLSLSLYAVHVSTSVPFPVPVQAACVFAAWLLWRGHQ